MKQIQPIARSIMAWFQCCKEAPPLPGYFISSPSFREMMAGFNRPKWNSPDSVRTRPAGKKILALLLFFISVVFLSQPIQAEVPVFVDQKDKNSEVSKSRSAERPKAEESIIAPVSFASPSTSDVFGANLFSGSFAKESYSGYNPDYSIGIGDKVTLKLWGAYNLETVLTVDAQGNIFIPKVGPVTIVGVRNGDLDKIVKRKVKKIYRANVQSYVNLAAAQPVKIFVSGFVQRPGMYSGLSSDSVLHFIDQAGGIDPDRGSFIEVKIKRGIKVHKTLNLYDFLLHGDMPLVQFADGDTILIGSRKATVDVKGLAQNKSRFELVGDSTSLDYILKLARAKPEATHVLLLPEQ